MVEKDYIDRHSLEKKVHTGMNIIEAMQAIIDAPAADVVEVRHGRWMFDFALGGSNFYKCSECGRQECLLEKYNAEKYMPYCHCGARMDGGVNDAAD